MRCPTASLRPLLTLSCATVGALAAALVAASDALTAPSAPFPSAAAIETLVELGPAPVGTTVTWSLLECADEESGRTYAEVSFHGSGSGSAESIRGMLGAGFGTAVVIDADDGSGALFVSLPSDGGAGGVATEVATLAVDEDEPFLRWWMEFE